MGDWYETTLGDFASLQRGHDLPDSTREAGLIPVMGSFGITGRHSVAKAKSPGVTVGRSGASIGVVSYIDEDYWPLNTCLYVTNFHGNNPRFVYYFLKSINLASYNSGSAQPSLNRNFIHPLIITVPKRPEQDNIAELLGALDDKIELNRQTNVTLEALARTIFKDWFVDFGPTRAKAEGREPYLSPELWEFFPDTLDDEDKPEGWEFCELQDIVELNPRESLKKGEEAPYLDMAALPTSGSIPDPPVSRAFLSGMRFRNGDTLLARITPCLENGKTAFVQSLPANNVAWGSTEFIVLRAKSHIPKAWTYLLARDSNFRAHAIQSMNGTSGRQRARTEALAVYPLVKPDIRVWEAFGNLIGPMFDRINAAGDESNTIAQTRDLLLPKLMSGEILLKDAERIVGEVA